MKLLYFILSIYLIGLSCVPCADIEVNSAAHTSTDMTANHDKHSHEKESDQCSPFCICNCCGAQILNYIPTANFEFPIVIAAIETKQSFYKSNLTSNFYGSIWQPPQIV